VFSLKSRVIHPNYIVIASFLSLILFGTILLSLPEASSGDRLSAVDALFTSTSAVCVTGLTVVDTGTHLSGFGQVLTMILIQIGGLGIATFSTFFIYMFGRKVSLRGRGMLETALTQFPVENLGRLLTRILGLTFAIEAVGALLLYFCFSRSAGSHHVAFSAIYHSISAFCNAGFSLYSTSLEGFRGDLGVNAVIMALVLLGGIGFVVIVELAEIPFSRRRDKRRLSLHSKVVLSITGSLLLVGTVVFLFLEGNHSMSGLPFGQKLVASLFQAVTPRTAGFSTVSINSCANGTLFFLIMLMFIGASPGSCGGGIKTTSFGVLMGLAFAKIRSSNDVNFFSRRVPDEIVSRAISVAFFSLVITVAMLMVLSVTEASLQEPGSGRSFLDLVFEAVSAFGTVGLSTGITPSLSVPGKLLVTVLMLVGRLGPLTIAIALAAREVKPRFRYAEENVMIG
jgi:trk system potassium uptake protein TrkH